MIRRLLAVALAAITGFGACDYSTTHAVTGLTVAISGPIGPGTATFTATNTTATVSSDVIRIHWDRWHTSTPTIVDPSCVMASYTHRVGKLYKTDPEVRCTLTLAAGATATLATHTQTTITSTSGWGADTSDSALNTALFWWNAGTPAVVTPVQILIYSPLVTGHATSVELYASNTGSLASAPAIAAFQVGDSDPIYFTMPSVPGYSPSQHLASLPVTPTVAGDMLAIFATSDGFYTKPVTVLTGLADLAVSQDAPLNVAAGDTFTRTVTVTNSGDGPTVGYLTVDETLTDLSLVGGDCSEVVWFSGTATNRYVHHEVHCVDYDQIPAGGQVTFTYQLAPTRLGIISSTVRIDVVGPAIISVPSVYMLLGVT